MSDPKEKPVGRTIEDLQKEKLEAEIEKIREETHQIRLRTPVASGTEDDIAREKLRAEVEKLKQETAIIRRAWYRQPSFFNLVVTLSVPVVSILAAYFLGGGKEYFDAKTISLQNQRHDLELQVKEFEERRDSLSRTNMRLTAAILQDSLRILSYEQDKARQREQIQGLSREKDKLNGRITEMKQRLVQAGFLEYFNKLIADKEGWNTRVNSGFFQGLVEAIQRDGEHRPGYIRRIDQVIDTTSNLQLKGTLQALRYITSHDITWKMALKQTAGQVCEEIKRNGTSRYGYAFWYIFSDIRWRDNAECIEIAHFLTECMHRISPNEAEAVSIFSVIAMLENQSDLQLYASLPDDFCYLLQGAIRGVHSGSVRGWGPQYFLRNHAPVAYVLVGAELLGDADSWIWSDAYQKGELLGVLSTIMDRNPDVFKIPPDNTASAEKWKEWQSDYRELYQVLNDVSAGNCDAAKLKTLVGNKEV